MELQEGIDREGAAAGYYPANEIKANHGPERRRRTERRLLCHLVFLSTLTFRRKEREERERGYFECADP